MKIVIALGGNALGNSAKEQLALVKETAQPIADLIEAGHQVIVAHGNGPQVGMIQSAFELSSKLAGTPEFPLPECGAMSQGYIGYHLQNAIREVLAYRGIFKEVVSLVTQVVVDPLDPAFQNPTKPVGQFFSKEQATVLEQEKGYTMIEDSGRGYRRVVPSPKPKDIVEKNVVTTLSDLGMVVITVGGGGIPVVAKDTGYTGVSAVIDKDSASAKLADIVNADYLFILTAIDRVMVNFNKPNQKAIEKMTVREARVYIEEKHFAPGSMLPKVLAAIDFVKERPSRTAIIASLDKAKEAIEGKTGTKVVA
jgi:carbamate kinase